MPLILQAVACAVFLIVPLCGAKAKQALPNTAQLRPGASPAEASGAKFEAFEAETNTAPTADPKPAPATAPSPSRLPSPSPKESAKPQAGEAFPPELTSPHTQIKKGEPFLLYARMRPAQGWHSYWSFAGDFGLPPKLSFPEVPYIKIRPLPLPTPKRKSFELNGRPAYSFVYEEEFLIPFELTVDKAHTAPKLQLSGHIEWSVCKEICISRKSPLKTDIAIGDHFKTDKKRQKLFSAHKNSFPQEDLNLKSSFKKQNDGALLSFYWERAEDIRCQDLFPSSRRDFSSRKPALLSQSAGSCSFQVEKPQAHSLSGLLLYSREGQKASSLFHSFPQKGGGLIWFALLAFIGGLILNLMPCVLPVIFLKFYNNLKLKGLTKGQILLLNLSYTAGVVSSFLLLAFVIFISKQWGENLGWGFHLQSPGFITCLVLLFSFTACSMAGWAPAFSPRISVFFKGKTLSHFMTGVLSTAAASPCTVPFMAGAVGFALSQGVWEIFLIFLFLGLGLSSPYLALALFPGALRYIPSPGRWTEILKRLLSIPLFATALWLVSLLYFQLDRRLFFASLLLLGLLFPVIFLYRRLKSQVLKKALPLIFISATGLLLWAQKAFHTPPPPPPVKNTRGLDWPAFDNNRLLRDKQKGRNIFIAFGAKWCLTCQFNEKLFNKPEFQQLVKDKNIRLYYGDWTARDPEGARFLKSMGRAGVPLYVFFKGEERFFLFPELLFKESFFDRLRKLSSPLGGESPVKK